MSQRPAIRYIIFQYNIKFLRATGIYKKMLYTQDSLCEHLKFMVQ